MLKIIAQYRDSPDITYECIVNDAGQHLCGRVMAESSDPDKEWENTFGSTTIVKSLIAYTDGKKDGEINIASVVTLIAGMSNPWQPGPVFRWVVNTNKGEWENHTVTQIVYGATMEELIGTCLVDHVFECEVL